MKLKTALGAAVTAASSAMVFAQTGTSGTPSVGAGAGSGSLAPMLAPAPEPVSHEPARKGRDEEEFEGENARDHGIGDEKLGLEQHPPSASCRGGSSFSPRVFNRRRGVYCRLLPPNIAADIGQDLTRRFWLKTGFAAATSFLLGAPAHAQRTAMRFEDWVVAFRPRALAREFPRPPTPASWVR